tara:strand:- start:153 stop:332 length:180 start_codon:yes stop_codon:yes gene_type:complete
MGQSISQLITRCIHGVGVDIPLDSQLYLDIESQEREGKIADMLKNSRETSTHCCEDRGI